MELSKPFTDKSTENDRLLRIGKIVGCHGVKGEVKVRTENAEPDWVGCLTRVVVFREGKPPVSCRVMSTRQQDHGGVLAQLEPIPDRTEAEKWVGAELSAYQSDLPEPEADAYRVDDLIGLMVLDAQHREEIGWVRDVLSSGGADFLELQPIREDLKPVVVPFQSSFFPEVDMSQGHVVLDKLGDLTELASTAATAQAPDDAGTP